ncbi:hypothetical protein [Cellulomonas sp. NPDC089187]|uniref:hypothetical protein n=1 Tax=Cellulomonas sp. NPDC089187 TaxID=3154970 RepID=UPI003438EA28
MSSDWALFLADHGWLVRADHVEVGPVHGWCRGPVAGLPAFSALLARSRVTELRVAGRPMELLAWDLPEGPRFTFGPAPWTTDRPRHPLLRSLAEAWGGSIYLSTPQQEQRTWWNPNLDQLLTPECLDHDIAGMLDAYAWIWTNEGLSLPIDVSEWDTVAVEANGNTTLAHHRTGQLLLFAPDTDDDGLTVLPGCPENSLYTIDDAPDLISWIEGAAA